MEEDFSAVESRIRTIRISAVYAIAITVIALEVVLVFLTLGVAFATSWSNVTNLCLAFSAVLLAQF